MFLLPNLLFFIKSKKMGPYGRPTRTWAPTRARAHASLQLADIGNWRWRIFRLQEHRAHGLCLMYVSEKENSQHKIMCNLASGYSDAQASLTLLPVLDVVPTSLTPKACDARSNTWWQWVASSVSSLSYRSNCIL